MSRYYCNACESPILLPENGVCHACKNHNHLATTFSQIIPTLCFKDLYGDWFFKIDEVRARNERTNEIVNIPTDQIVYR